MKEKIKQLENNSLVNPSISYDELIKMGFDDYEIKSLIMCNIIEFKNDTFMLSAKKLLKLQEYYYNNNDIISSIKCLKILRRCYFDNKEINLLIITRYIEISNYHQAYKNIKCLKEEEVPNYQAFVYLLGKLNDLYGFVDDVDVSKKKEYYCELYKNVNSETSKVLKNVYLNIFNDNYKDALDLLNSINTNSSELIILKKILTELSNIYCEEKNDILLEYAKYKRYDKITEYLEKKYNSENLTFEDYLIKTLLDKIKSIKESNEFPQTVIDSTDNYYNAIIGNNFELALNLFDYNNQIIELLLTELCELKKQFDIDTKVKRRSSYV